MSRISLTRSEVNIPFIVLLKQIGAPVEALLRQVRLPTQLDPCSGAYLPSHLMYRFRNRSAEREGIENLGFLVGQTLWRTQGASSALLKSLQQSLTLKQAIHELDRMIQKEALGARVWIAPEREDQVWLCWHRSVEFDSIRQEQSTLFMFAVMIQLVREWVDLNWFPIQVTYDRTLTFDAKQQQSLQGARVIPSRRVEGFCLPRGFLSLPAQNSFNFPSNPKAPPPSSSKILEEDFVALMRRVLKAYLADGYPPIELAAAISNCSVRTLQRRLVEHHLTYSELIEQLRYQLAVKALTESDIPVIELAYNLGYQSHAGFTRAFHRLAGVSPKGFRQCRQATAAGVRLATG